MMKKVTKTGVNPPDFLASTQYFRKVRVIPEAVIDEILTTLNHARTFIASREKMHPDGIKLYDGLTKNLKDFYGDS